VVFLSPILALCWEECVVSCYYADGLSAIKWWLGSEWSWKCTSMWILQYFWFIHRHPDENCTGGKFQLWNTGT
jgi:hypothetical protein